MLLEKKTGDTVASASSFRACNLAPLLQLRTKPRGRAARAEATGAAFYPERASPRPGGEQGRTPDARLAALRARGERSRSRCGAGQRGVLQGKEELLRRWTRSRIHSASRCPPIYLPRPSGRDDIEVHNEREEKHNSNMPVLFPPLKKIKSMRICHACRYDDELITRTVCRKLIPVESCHDNRISLERNSASARNASAASAHELHEADLKGLLKRSLITNDLPQRTSERSISCRHSLPREAGLQPEEYAALLEDAKQVSQGSVPPAPVTAN